MTKHVGDVENRNNDEGRKGTLGTESEVTQGNGWYQVTRANMAPGENLENDDHCRPDEEQFRVSPGGRKIFHDDRLPELAQKLRERNGERSPPTRVDELHRQQCGSKREGDT